MQFVLTLLTSKNGVYLIANMVIYRNLCQVSYKQLFSDRTLRLTLIIGLALQGAQQLSGVNAVSPAYLPTVSTIFTQSKSFCYITRHLSFFWYICGSRRRGLPPGSSYLENWHLCNLNWLTILPFCDILIFS